MRRPSGTKPTPDAAIRNGGKRVQSLPKMLTLPVRAGVRPTRLRSVVDLPAPLRPSNVVMLPSATVKPTSCRMWLLP